MTSVADLSIRARVTTAFAVVMAVLLAGLAAVLYASIGSALLDEIDTGLRFRAASLMSVPQVDVTEHRQAALEEPDESFDQLVAADGTVLRNTPGIQSGPLIGGQQLARVHGPTFSRRHVSGVADEARLLAVPVPGAARREVLVVGASMSDRTDALHLLTLVLVVGGAVAVALASLAGWFTAGLALRPMERIRREAAAITASGIDRRIEPPRTHDELRQLADTLNDLLARLDDALAGERRFLARASHELRTPLSALKAELDLARSRPRSAEEQQAALASAADETDRLVLLANDLLLLARSHGGELPVHREETGLRGLVEASVDAFAARAAGEQREVTCSVPDDTVRVDAMRVRQALDNLIDNALRHTSTGGSVDISAVVDDGVLRLSVTDHGDGFDRSSGDTGTGLGLVIARGVATGHGGRLEIGRGPDGGACVVLVLADVALPGPVSGDEFPASGAR